MLDIVLVTSPITFTDSLLTAGAILGAMLKKHGFSYDYIDINAEINQDLEKHKPLVDFCLDYYNISNADYIADHLKITAQRILEKKSSLIGISLFCFQNQNYTKLLCQELKIQSPTCKIVLGGPGIITDGLLGKDNFAKVMLDLKLIDSYIVGDGEYEIIKLLQNFKSNFKNNQILDINSLPHADYEKYNFNLYKEQSLGIIGSKGCVRKCSFCDIHQHWKKYVYRSGKNIVSEMIENSEKYNIKSFKFQDSLVNGSMKSYREMVTLLANLNQNKASKITWQGQFIFRPSNQMTNNDWKLTKLSGVSQIYVGIESFIEHIRNHMGKKFSNDDIWFSLDRCLEYDIKCGILLIVGYVTETEKDHYENLKIVEKLEKYKSIVSVSVGTTLGILKNTPLYNNAQKLGISLGSHENNWVNENSNFHERVKRQSDLKDKLKELGIELSNEAQQNWMI